MPKSESITEESGSQPDKPGIMILLDAIFTHLRAGKGKTIGYYEDLCRPMGPQSITTAHLCAIDKDCEDFEGPILAQLQPISAIVHTKPTS
ncbi:hypothetical protein Tco_0117373 [Tanacetum coccineum]